MCPRAPVWSARFCARLLSATGLLLGVEFLDELWSGATAIAAPAVRSDLCLSYTALALATMTVPFAVALVVEPPLMLWIERRSRPRALVAAVTALALGVALASLAGGPIALAVAMVCAFIASGVATTLAQVALMDADPDRRELWMARWTLVGTLGDLAAPLVIAVAAVLSPSRLGWRVSLGLCAGVCAVHALVLVRLVWLASTPGVRQAGVDTSGQGPPVLQAVGTALRNRRLLAWSVAGLLCGLLDELLVTFGALHMRDTLGFDTGTRSAALFACSSGAAVGLVAAERLLARVDPLRLLASSAVACAVAVLAWWMATDPTTSTLLLFLVGMTAAPHYPIVQAQAYRAMPEAAIVVAVVGGIFDSLGLAMPLVLGTVADRYGLPAATVLLVIQPVLLLVTALVSMGRGKRSG